MAASHFLQRLFLTLLLKAYPTLTAFAQEGQTSIALETSTGRGTRTVCPFSPSRFGRTCFL